MQESATSVLGRAGELGAAGMAASILSWWQEAGLGPLLARAYNMAVQASAASIQLRHAGARHGCAHASAITRA